MKNWVESVFAMCGEQVPGSPWVNKLKFSPAAVSRSPISQLLALYMVIAFCLWLRNS